MAKIAGYRDDHAPETPDAKRPRNQEFVRSLADRASSAGQTELPHGKQLPARHQFEATHSKAIEYLHSMQKEGDQFLGKQGSNTHLESLGKDRPLEIAPHSSEPFPDPPVVPHASPHQSSVFPQDSSPQVLGRDGVIHPYPSPYLHPQPLTRHPMPKGKQSAPVASSGCTRAATLANLQEPPPER